MTTTYQSPLLLLALSNVYFERNIARLNSGTEGHPLVDSFALLLHRRYI